MDASTVMQEIAAMRPLLPTYLHLIVSAVFPIYAAAHASLRRPATAARRPKSEKGKDHSQEEDDESTSPIETLTTSDAILFPILAGVTLSLLYVIIKWLEDPAILNKLLGYYFGWVGTFFTFSFLRDSFHLLRAFVFPSSYSLHGLLYNAQPNAFKFTQIPPDETNSSTSATRSAGLEIVKYVLSFLSKSKLYWKTRQTVYKQVSCVVTMRKPLTPGRFEFKVDLVDTVAAVTATSLAMLQLGLKQIPWYLINLSGISFCYGSLQFITPGTSTTGSLLLSLLFFYDIYMVFYTPMMVTVATKLDVPIKLLFPRPDDGTCPKPVGVATDSEEMKEYLKCLAKKRTMAMLGLGDIVVPGIMIAYALRFDLYNYYRQMRLGSDRNLSGQERNSSGSQKNPKPAYLPARGMWAERFYTARELWSPSLRAKSFPKPYFKSTLFGYIAGLMTTVLVMQIFKHAQPALLYLVPGVLSAFWGMSLWRQETLVLWHYDEAEEEDLIAEQKQKEEKARKIGNKANTINRTDPNKDNALEARDFLSTQATHQHTPMFSFNIYQSATDRTEVNAGSSDALPSQHESSHSIITQNTTTTEDNTRMPSYSAESDTDTSSSSHAFTAKPS